MDEIRVPATMADYDTVLRFVLDRVEAAEPSPAHTMQIELVLEEVFVNIASYAYPDGNSDGQGMVVVQIDLKEDTREVVLAFKDWGRAFNPLDKPDPDITLSADEREIGGLGIFLVKKYMDSVGYEHVDGMNVLTMRKALA